MDALRESTYTINKR